MTTAHRRTLAYACALYLVAACGGEKMTSARVPDPTLMRTTVDVPFCNTLAPNWVAFQDGNGSWTRALPVVDGQKTRFRYAFASGYGSIAIVRIVNNRLTALTIQYGSPEELITVSDTAAINCGPAGTNTLLGTVSGLDVNDVGDVRAGFGPGALLAPGTTNFELHGLVPGPQDILARRISRENDTGQVTKFILRRTPDLPDNTLLAPLDFNSGEAFEPVLAQVTLLGVELDGAILASGLQTRYSQSFLGGFAEPAAGALQTILALPAARLRDGDLQLAAASAPADDGRRSASTYFRAPDDQILTLGAVGTVPALSTIATTPSLRLRATFDTQSDYDRLTSIAFQQDQILVTVGMTNAYARVAAGFDLVMPDLSGVAGFDPGWSMHANAPVFWTAMRIGGTLGLGVDAQPFAGATSRTAERFGSFSP